MFSLGFGNGESAGAFLGGGSSELNALTRNVSGTSPETCVIWPGVSRGISIRLAFDPIEFDTQADRAACSKGDQGSNGVTGEDMKNAAEIVSGASRYLRQARSRSHDLVFKY